MNQKAEIDVEAIKAGDRGAFRHLYDRYQSAVLALAYSIVSDWSMAEDVCQEVFLKVYQRLDQYQIGTNLKAWILTIGHHTAIDAVRRGRREVEVPEDLPGPGTDLDSRKAFADMLAPLGPDERLVVTLKYLEDLPYRDIARITGKAEGTLRNLVSGALRKLRGVLGRTGGL